MNVQSIKALALLEGRVRQFQHPRALARVPAPRTVHQVGNVQVLGPDGRVARVGSTLAYTLTGRVREGFELFEKSEVKALRPLRLVCLGKALVHARRIDDAARVALETLEQARLQGARALEASTVGRAEALAMRPLAARCHLRLAWHYHGTGQSEFTAHRDAAKRLLAQMGGLLRRDALDEEALA